MPIPAAETRSPIIILVSTTDIITTVSVPVHIIRWNLTTAVTTTWALQVTQSTVMSGTTVSWPLIGTTTVSAGVEGSTGIAGPRPPFLDYRIDAWCYGVVPTVMTGGFLTIIKGNPGEDWVMRKPVGA